MVQKRNRNDQLPSTLADALFKNEGDVEAVAREIRKTLASGDDALAQFLGLLESLRDVVPDEDKCHAAALTALERTLGRKKSDVARAVRGHRDALSRLREQFVTSSAERQAEARVLERRASEIKDRIAEAEARIQKFRSEEKAVAAALAECQSAAGSAEERFEAAMVSVQAEIEELARRMKDAEASEGDEDVQDFSPRIPPESESAPRAKKQCPSCKADMEWQEEEKSWQCPSCGYHRVEFF